MSTFQIQPDSGLQGNQISIQVGLTNAGHFFARVEKRGEVLVQSELGVGLATIGEIERLIAPWAKLSERKKKALRQLQLAWERERHPILRPEIGRSGTYRFGSHFIETFAGSRLNLGSLYNTFSYLTQMNIESVPANRLIAPNLPHVINSWMHDDDYRRSVLAASTIGAINNLLIQGGDYDENSPTSVPPASSFKDDEEFVRLVTLLHEGTHYCQDLTTGAGHLNWLALLSERWSTRLGLSSCELEAIGDVVVRLDLQGQSRFLLEAEATATTLLMLGRQKMKRQEILISMRHQDIFSPAYMEDIYKEAFCFAEIHLGKHGIKVLDELGGAPTLTSTAISILLLINELVDICLAEPFPFSGPYRSSSSGMLNSSSPINRWTYL